MPVQGRRIISSASPTTPTQFSHSPSPTGIPPFNAYLFGGVGFNAAGSHTPVARRRGDSLPGSSPILSSPFAPSESVSSPPAAASVPTPLLPLSLGPSALPPLSSDGIMPTSPIVGTKEERKASARAKGARKRTATMAAQQATREADAEEDKLAIFDVILETLDKHGLTFGQLMLYIFDPVYKQGATRWEGFFQERGLARRILDLWVSKKNSATAREEVGTWAEDYVAAEMQAEGRKVTASRFLQRAGTVVDHTYITSFTMPGVGAFLQNTARVSMKMASALATSSRTIHKNLAARSKKRFTIVTSAVLALLGEYSHKNNYSRRIMGLYLYATGAQRQTISVMSHLGISESYQSITHKPRPIVKRHRKRLPLWHDPPPVPPSTPPEESETPTHLSPDPVALATKSKGCSTPNSQENGTCATIFPLWKAAIENMRISDLNAAFDKAPPLTLKDILLTTHELKLMEKCLRHCILRIIVDDGGEKFKRFRDALDDSLPVTPEKIELHKTPLHPLPAWMLDESTIVGNTQVAYAIYEELKVKGLSHWSWAIKILAGDQLSIARLRSLLNIRAGNEGGFSGFADMHGFFVTHWGFPNRGTRNPGSLAFHNTHLHRSPIVLSSLPLFRVCRDLAFVSLYSRILHCLLLVTGETTLDQCADSITSFAQLEKHAASIQSKYANADLVADLRWQREMARGAEGLPPGDEIYENACLFIRDALISKEFSDAIKAGDSGRVVLVVKLLALSFRGNGRSKYAYEMLHLIHNLTHVWPKGIRAIVLNNWLVNPTGNPFSWVEVDLMQEHMNFWIKTIYQAHGSAASWEWLAMVAPCITALRHLSTSIINILGSDQGTKHEPADLSTDIRLLMKSLAENHVYQIQGRVFAEEDGAPTLDVITAGIQQLSDSTSNPLKEYNAAFLQLQARRRLTPLVDSWSGSESDSDGAHHDTAAPPSVPPVPTPTAPRVSLPQPEVPAVPTRDFAQPSPPLIADDQSETSNSSDDGSLFDEDLLSAFERVMDEVDGPTLTRDTAADVALDMDGGDEGFIFGGEMREDSDSDSDSDADPFVDDLNDLDYVDME
ncbi:hypothetical protein DFH09DRAFT_1428362 [Mycena vulgaris]|nr:hypothetical protein DFH09DRAFT_1428362 [Mycena vulgaris]